MSHETTCFRSAHDNYSRLWSFNEANKMKFEYMCLELKLSSNATYRIGLDCSLPAFEKERSFTVYFLHKIRDKMMIMSHDEFLQHE